MQKLSKSVCLSSPAIEFIIPLNSTVNISELGSNWNWAPHLLGGDQTSGDHRRPKGFIFCTFTGDAVEDHTWVLWLLWVLCIPMTQQQSAADCSVNFQMAAELFLHRAAGLVFQFWRTSGWLSVVYNTTAAIANRQTIARLSCSKNCWQLLQWLQAKGIEKSYLTNPGRLYQRGFHAHNLVCKQGMKIPPWRGIPDSGNLTPLQFFNDLPLRTLMQSLGEHQPQFPPWLFTVSNIQVESRAHVVNLVWQVYCSCSFRVERQSSPATLYTAS